METLFINGKFMAQPATGVQRVAAQLLLALDRLLQDAPATRHEHRRWVLLCPPGAALPRYGFIEARHAGKVALPLHVWEQVVLPWHARSGRLLNLAGSAPALPSGQICTFHDAAVFDHPEAYTASFVRWYRWMFRRQARRAARLLTVSAFSQVRLALRLGLPTERIAVVPNGSDHFDGVEPDDRVLDQHGLRGQPFVLAVGSANPTKNLARLVEAFDAMDPALPATLVIAGGSNPRVFAQRPGDEMAGRRRVVRTGMLGDAQLKSLYGHALMLVFPSIYEGFGLPPLEAMACGCPVVAARAAALPEVCGDAVVYVDPLSTSQITQAMQRLLTDAAFRQRLADGGPAHAHRWRWQRSAVALRKVADEVA